MLHTFIWHERYCVANKIVLGRILVANIATKKLILRLYFAMQFGSIGCVFKAHKRLAGLGCNSPFLALSSTFYYGEAKPLACFSGAESYVDSA